jgi:hypothetical protein
VAPELAREQIALLGDQVVGRLRSELADRGRLI